MSDRTYARGVTLLAGIVLLGACGGGSEPAAPETFRQEAVHRHTVARNPGADDATIGELVDIVSDVCADDDDRYFELVAFGDLDDTADTNANKLAAAVAVGCPHRWAEAVTTGTPPG